jgi:hypothetical protein
MIGRLRKPSGLCRLRIALAQRLDRDLDRTRAAVVVGDKDVGLDGPATIGVARRAEEVRSAETDDEAAVGQLGEAALTD